MTVMAKPDRAMSKSERAHEWIRARIVSREFTPGYRLVLGAIATELEMSVVPVREAIRRLEAEGLVTFERNVGARVAMADDSQYRYAMHSLGILEGAATALTAPLITADQLAEAREINRRMADELEQFDPQAFTALNQQFHRILFGACPNPHLLELVDTEWARLARLRSSTFSFVPGRAAESVSEHDEILRLIGDSAPLAEVEHAARTHRTATLEAYLAHEHPDKAHEFPEL